jgi:hypothetical protein
MKIKFDMKQILDFLKKNYLYLILSAASLGLAITFIVFLSCWRPATYAVVENPALGVAGGLDQFNATGAMLGLIAGVLVFSALIAPFVMMMLEKTKQYAKWALCGVGCMGICFMSLAMFVPMQSDSYALVMEIRSGAKDQTITAYVQDMTVTGAFEALEKDIEDKNLAPTDPEYLAFRGLQRLQDVLTSTPVAEWDTIFGLKGVIEPMQAELQPIIEAQSAAAIKTAKDTANNEFTLNMAKLIMHLVCFGFGPVAAGLALVFIKSKASTDKSCPESTVVTCPSTATGDC